LGSAQRAGVLLAAALAVVVALASSAPASAHGGGTTIALDYRLRLDRAVAALPGVHVAVRDGDRALEARVDDGARLLVRGALREPLLRIGSDGVWVNGDSPTATADGLVSGGGSGWVRVRDGRSFVWHDHRLGPPPATTPGTAGRFSIPVEVDGKAAVIAGTFIRVERPSPWPWVAVGLGLAGAIWLVARRRPWRAGLTLVLGITAGIGAVVSVTTFALRASPTGGVSSFELVFALAVGGVLGALLIYLRGRARIHTAGAVGAIAAAVSISSFPIFWHGVVISALPDTGARVACAVAFVCGAAAAALSFVSDADEPRRTAT
jgi:hypothetical protein